MLYNIHVITLLDFLDFLGTGERHGLVTCIITVHDNRSNRSYVPKWKSLGVATEAVLLVHPADTSGSFFSLSLLKIFIILPLAGDKALAIMNYI